jgi:pimeloyl-ACP methyl ester carboxylesterase
MRNNTARPQRDNTAYCARVSRRFLFVLACSLGAVLFAGCTGERYLTLRKIPSTPLADPLGLIDSQGPSPTPRTVQLLRRLDVGDAAASGDHTPELARLEQLISEDPTPDKVYSYAELAFIVGKEHERAGKNKESLDFFARSVANAYLYLFDEQFDARRNKYDPEFRLACDVYNSSLEAAMRILHKTGQFKPGGAARITTLGQTFTIDVVLRGPWSADEIESIDFVSNYELQGLKNQYHTYGLGVPLILNRKTREIRQPSDEFYPPSLSLPATAFLHVMTTPVDAAPGSGERHCRLEILDPLATTDLIVRERRVPLETDLSIPLAHGLDQPSMRENDWATTGLLNPGAAEQSKGLYLMEPYDPHKIPVVMVHGLWSSPMTWMEMFNDLRALPEIRERYQFWFYLYPTGQPFWISAAQFRSDLNHVLTTLDAHKECPSLRHMVLIGHSMGGLVSKMQTLYSDDRFWGIVSEKTLDELKAPDDIKQKVRSAVYFEPNPAVQRLITIATPHRGSNFANDATRWLSHYLINLPAKMMASSQALMTNNPGFFRSTELIATSTSIDSLAPDHPVLMQMLEARKADWIHFHNIVGVVEGQSLIGRVTSEGDGIVTLQSAHLDDVESEIRTPADHVTVHRHPRSVLEVRRILSEHAAQFDAEHGKRAIRRISKVRLTDDYSEPAAQGASLRSSRSSR